MFMSNRIPEESQLANKKAFSLIELILVVVVLGIAVFGLITVAQEVMLETHKPEVISTATALAEKEAERVTRLSFAAVDDENRDSPQSYGGNFSTYSWEVRVDSIDDAAPNLGSDPDMDNYKVVEIRIHHDLLGGYISLVFLRTNY
jgi:prepilin-type N-terminal cleavage/methylation domain-containing protein